jgi:hypothetical protein
MIARLVTSMAMASMLAWAGQATAQGDAPERPVRAAGGAEKTRDAMEQLRRALVEWRKELGPDGKIDAETAEELQKSLRALNREVGPILSARLKPASDPTPVQAAADVREQWVKDVRALGPDAARRRDAAVAAMREALAGRDAAAQFAALQALAQTGDIKYDRTPFRPLILPIIEGSRDELLGPALYALYNVGRQPGDLAVVQAAYARNPAALAPSISHLLFLFGDGVIAGESEAIVLKQLAARVHSTRRETLRGLWGARVTPPLSARLVELADDAEMHHEVIYFGLSTLQEKDEAVIDKLIATLSDPDWTNNGQRALWGLGYGIPEALQPKVAAALVDLHNTHSEARVRNTCAELVRRYGGEAMAAKLDK